MNVKLDENDWNNVLKLVYTNRFKVGEKPLPVCIKKLSGS